MRTQRLGCLTPIGLLAALITVLVITGAVIARGGSIFSPGDLSDLKGPQLGGYQSHAETGGDCLTCHSSPWDTASMSDRCLDCHTQIQADLSSPTTLHGHLIGLDGPANCRACHTEHHGANASLTRLNIKDFPHEVTGFALTAHAQHADGRGFECQDCHESFTKVQSVVCFDCHTRLDPVFAADHKTAFDANCRACHDGVDSYGSAFNHSSGPFPLTGRHVDVKCLGCHQNQASIAILKTTPQNCESCHLQDDAHAGKLGINCASCHTPDDWKPSTFDHNTRTSFVLIGKHLQVACDSCHEEHVKGTPKECAACHLKDDAHEGKLGTDCAFCHSPEGWKPSTFDHNTRSSFILIGKHTSVACESCHVNQVLKGTPKACASCHIQDDPHEDQLGSDCAACHTPQGWKPSTFDHNRSSFQLIGKHQQTACTSCHTDLRFKGTPAACISCHREDDTHRGELGPECSTCHTPQGWKPSTFDHGRSSFALTGAHKTVQCSSCHVNYRYKGTPAQCFACHQKDEPHHGQFGTDCTLCHTTNSWGEITFDHNRSSFKLTGAHNNVACTRCHEKGRFRGTPSACAACHAEPQIHAGVFGTDCALCHNTSAWLPAGYNGPHSFPMNHGDARTCRDCHTASYATYNCYNCHDQGEITKKHQEEGIGDFSNCLRCHPYGNKEEGGEGD